MKKKKAKIKAILDLVERFAEMGVIDSDERTALRKAVGELSHALSIKDFSKMEKAIDTIARLLMRM